MVRAFAQAALHGYRRDGLDRSQIPYVSKQHQFVASFRTNYGADTFPRVLRSGKKDAYEIIVAESDEED